jgi:hypothetical protein
VQVVEDPGGERPDTWRTHRACLDAMPARASHLLVLQDDAIVCGRFAARLREAVRAHPEQLLALFVPGFPFLARRLEQQRGRGEPFATLLPAAFVPLVALVYPRHHVEALRAYVDGSSWPRAHRMGTADDAVVAGYVRANRLSVIATVPSLVDHDDSVPSISKPSHRAGPHRRAAIFAAGDAR